MLTSVPAAVYSTVATLAAIASATVAAWHGTIDGQTYSAIVTGALGLTLGAGIHAAGTQSAVRTVTEAASPTLAGSATTADLQAELDKRKGSA